MSTIGVPTKLLQESLGHVITVELKTGQVYRGKLFEGQSRRRADENGMAEAREAVLDTILTLYYAVDAFKQPKTTSISPSRTSPSRSEMAE